MYLIDEVVKIAESNSVTFIPQCSCLNYQGMMFFVFLTLNKKALVFIQKCYRTCFKKIKRMINDVLCVADNAKDEVYEIAQLLKNDDSVLSIGFLNDGAYSQ